MNLTLLYQGIAAVLILVGLAGLLTRRNLIRMVIGFSLVDTGLHLALVSFGHVPDATAPIVDDASMFESVGSQLVADGAVVDPIVQAMVLTAIVIGVGVTALLLSYVVRLYARRGTLDVSAIGRLKW